MVWIGVSRGGTSPFFAAIASGRRPVNDSIKKKEAPPIFLRFLNFFRIFVRRHVAPFIPSSCSSAKTFKNHQLWGCGEGTVLRCLVGSHRAVETSILLSILLVSEDPLRYTRRRWGRGLQQRCWCLSLFLFKTYSSWASRVWPCWLIKAGWRAKIQLNKDLLAVRAERNPCTDYGLRITDSRKF